MSLILLALLSTAALLLVTTILMVFGPPIGACFGAFMLWIRPGKAGGEE